MTAKISDFVQDFTRDIPRGLSSRYLAEQAVPQARWQAPDVIRDRQSLAYDPADPGDKILIGAFGDRLIGIKDDRHILTVAGNRSGKSVTLIANFLHYRGSVLAIDPKGELANITAECRAALGQRVCVLDPFRRAAPRLARFRARYNPLAVLTLDNPTIIEDAGLIADGLVVTPPGVRDPHWDESARNFIEGLILHVATEPAHQDERTLVTVRTLINWALTKLPAGAEDEPADPGDGVDDPASADQGQDDEEEEDDGDDRSGDGAEEPGFAQPDDEPRFVVLAEMLHNARRLQADERTADIGAAIEGAALDFYQKSERERSSVLSTVRRHTKLLDYAAMRAVLSGHDVDLAALKRAADGVTLYLCLPALRMGLCNRWLRIIINQLLDAMEREPAPLKAPVLVCLDEFPVLGYMRQLEDAAGQIASFGLKLWVVLQDWGQGRALYGERWETFAGNAGLLQFFGNNDLATTEYVSRRLGKTRVEVSRASEIAPEQRDLGLTGRAPAIELHPLLTADEISRHFARSDRLKRQLVIWAGYDPMILQRVEYYDEASPYFASFQGLYAPAS